MSAIEGVSETFDPEAWDVVPGFEGLTDLTYHRDRAHGTVRIAFDRPDVLNVFRSTAADPENTTCGFASTWLPTRLVASGVRGSARRRASSRSDCLRKAVAFSYRLPL